MFNKILSSLNELSEMVRSQASSLGEGARERSEKLIEEWLKVFPKLEVYGLKITSFALSAAISPALEVELVRKHVDFTPVRLREIMAENPRSPAILSVMNTIKTAYILHRKSYADLEDPLILKIRVRLSPEIKVYIGKHLIE